jgi:hypothetical protein
MKTNIPRDFYSQIKKTDSCWVWIGVTNDAGYGMYKGKSAHRLSYTIHKGKIGSGLSIDHLCRRHDCVNPSHLDAVSHSENIRRASAFRKANGIKVKRHKLEPVPISKAVLIAEPGTILPLNLLLVYLRKLKINPSILSKHCGISPCTIYNIIAGRSGISTRMAGCIAVATNTTAVLVGGEFMWRCDKQEVK